MNRFQGPLTISIFVVAAFIWGYKKDALHGAFASLQTPTAEPPAEMLRTPAAVPASPQRPAPPGPRPPAAHSPPAPGMLPQAAAPAPQAPAAVPPGNPYAGLSAKLAERGNPGSMAETFDSIRRDSVDQRQVIQKNAYFRKLSEQLKELRGEEPQPQEGAGLNPAATADGTEPPPLPGSREVQAPGGRRPPVLPQPGTLPDDEEALEDDPDEELSEEEALVDELDQLLEADGPAGEEALD